MITLQFRIIKYLPLLFTIFISTIFLSNCVRLPKPSIKNKTILVIKDEFVNTSKLPPQMRMKFNIKSTSGLKGNFYVTPSNGNAIISSLDPGNYNINGYTLHAVGTENPRKPHTYSFNTKFELKINQITVLNRKIVAVQKPYDSRGGWRFNVKTKSITDSEKQEVINVLRKDENFSLWSIYEEKKYVQKPKPVPVPEPKIDKGDCGYRFYVRATEVNTVKSIRNFLNKCNDPGSSYYSIAYRTLNNKLKTKKSSPVKPSVVLTKVTSPPPKVTNQSEEECYLFVSGDIGEEKSVVDQIVRPLIGSFVSTLKEDPVDGLSQSELNSSCYYDVSVNKVGETINLSISGQRTSVPFNGLSESSRSFPENIRHSTLRIFHKELSKSKKEIICQEYGKFLVDECSLQPETIKERPETIVVPVSVMGDVSNIRRQILQNTLDDELKEHFRLIPQDRFEEVQEKVFEELKYEECTEDQCIKMIQEMLQVENMFHLQVIGEEGDTQLTLKWVNLDEKRVEEDFCEDCKTRELRKMIGGLVERLIGKK